MNGSTFTYCLERRVALGDGNEAALEPEHVRQHERGDAQQGVGHDVERDEQAVVPLTIALPAEPARSGR